LNIDKFKKEIDINGDQFRVEFYVVYSFANSGD